MSCCGTGGITMCPDLCRTSSTPARGCVGDQISARLPRIWEWRWAHRDRRHNEREGVKLPQFSRAEIRIRPMIARAGRPLRPMAMQLPFYDLRFLFRRARMFCRIAIR
jgi:hypothetical protein